MAADAYSSRDMFICVRNTTEGWECLNAIVLEVLRFQVRHEELHHS